MQALLLLLTTSLVYGAVSFTKREISNKESHTSGPYCYDKRKTTSVIRNPSMKHTRSAMLSMMLSQTSLTLRSASTLNTRHVQKKKGKLKRHPMKLDMIQKLWMNMKSITMKMVTTASVPLKLLQVFRPLTIMVLSNTTIMVSMLDHIVKPERTKSVRSIPRKSLTRSQRLSVRKS